MQIYSKIIDLQQALLGLRKDDRSVGIVPTMGNLHAGHLKLINTAKENCDFVICTIFVNPLQFGPNEDLDAYPRTLSRDIQRLKEIDCDCLFHPESDELYPLGIQSQTKVTVPDLGLRHCGQSRPGHFDGVTTVVNKLFNICQPSRAFFGLKDYQQYLLIRKMASDLHMPIEIIGVETHREPSGLAMSSRNTYLDQQQLQVAPVLYRTLVNTADRLKSGDHDFLDLEAKAKQSLVTGGVQPDYFAICNSETLLPAISSDKNIVILAAAYVGKSRLIDNVRLSLS